MGVEKFFLGKKQEEPAWKKLSPEQIREKESAVLRREIETLRAHANELEQDFDKIVEARSDTTKGLPPHSWDN
jgi:hypothetical protein